MKNEGNGSYSLSGIVQAVQESGGLINVEGVSIVCYRILMADENDLVDEYRVINLPEASLFIVRGSISYQVAVSSWEHPNRYYKNVEKVFEITLPGATTYITVQERATENGLYLLVLAPPAGSTMERFTDSPRVVRELRGALTVVFGRNIAFGEAFRIEINANSEASTVIPAAFENPRAYPTPDINDKALNDFIAFFGAIESQDQQVREKVRLSLNWYERGLEASGIDALLSYWIAIEVLAMPGSDVRPVNQELANIYGIAYQDATARFGVGRIQGFRSNIVHSGWRPNVSRALLNYMASVYIDILYSKLCLNSRRLADSILADSSFDLKTQLAGS